MFIFPCRLYNQESTNTSPESWVIVLDQLTNEGRPFNWSNMLSLQLKEQVT